ncbi:hypothetical protein SKAU_G00358930 [Synaphobranchus kaupii]|uniref:UDP-glycosyltransferases domain-containing protein n=1 Tax=Synaphobranchus kaupii TaxID=118154 RepID=A0A9Q1IGP8_SYNKA|nr:hypothetical protein SKAU_G00358930 [Synaphobranchus kaupii]
MFYIGHFAPVLVLSLCQMQHTYSGKVLLWPGEYSHWLNMKSIVAALAEKGHEMTVLIPSASPTIKVSQSSGCSFEIVPVPYTAQDMNDIMDKVLRYCIYDLPNDSFIQIFLKLKALIAKSTEKNKAFCRAVFENKELLEKLRRAQYDVLVSDPVFLCGELLADTLDLPFIISFRFSFANTIERLCGQLPAPPSYVPREYSHWLNMLVILEELITRNHTITVLVCSASPSVTYTKAEPYHFEIFEVPFSKTEMRGIFEDSIHFRMYEAADTPVLRTTAKVVDLLVRMTALRRQMCEAMFRNDELLNRLTQSKYELVLTDPMVPCGDLLSEKLGVPLVISLRALSVSIDLSEFIGKPTTFCEVIGKADIWLIRTYWDFEYPRPFLPNFKFVGGLHCKPAKPLPEDLEGFVQSSGEDGIVVFSLGSMIKNLTRERRNTIASALGQIPQKILWSYSGEKPDTLAPNTRVYDWIPQNDLLGHAKTKVFITHGGTNGIYEAIYHGVPMVGIPLFVDQPDNMMHMKTKGAAVTLDFTRFQAQDLVDALNTVIHDPSYKESAMRLSGIHHDQPMKPLDRAVFWIEFVMRNKGAKHLRVQSHNLSWYQYHCLDVLAALLATVALVTVIFFKACCFCLRKCCLRSKTKSKAE